MSISLPTEPVYGVQFVEIPPLPETLLPAAREGVLATVRLSQRHPYDSQLIAHSKFVDSAGVPVGTLAQTSFGDQQGHLLTIRDGAEYCLLPTAILCYAPPEVSEDSLWGYFFSAALPLWFELRGQPALHAGTVAINGRGVSFLTHSGGGKSTLNAMMVAAGFLLVADDVTIFQRDSHGRIIAPPGPRQLKMWTETALRLVGRYEDFPRVHPRIEKRAVPIGVEGFGHMATEAVPMRALYLVERYQPATPNDTTIQIVPLSPAQAVIELLKASMLIWFPQALGLQPARIKFLGELVAQASVKRLRYPSGWEHLDQVRAAVCADVEG